MNRACHPGAGGRRSVAATVAGALAVVVVLAVAACQVSTPVEPAPRRIFAAAQAVRIGVTHTQTTADSTRPAEATARARQILRDVTDYGNQHIMGWGAENPEPAPGVYDWSTLDGRVSLLTAAGTEPVITLCCAPDWMKGGQPGQTDWSRLEVAPDRAHFADFTALAVAVARRYPQVHRYVVWNELKGFYDDVNNRWDAQAYTDLYNQVYTALKQQDPTVQVGGPYVPMDSWSSAKGVSNPSSVAGEWGVLDQRALDAVDYWLAHSAGADFVAVDGGTKTKDGKLAAPAVANQKFTAVTRWLAGRTKLPIWWMEMYPDVANEPWNSAHRADVAADALLRFADAGGSVAFFWQPEGDNSFPSVGLWNSTADAGGGQPQPLVDRLAQLRAAWSEGYRVDGRWNGGELVLTRTEEQ